MALHLENILKILKDLESNMCYSNQLDIIKTLQIKIEYIITEIIELKRVNQINLKEIGNISDIIYNFNVKNVFSRETDKISNEYYAFQFLLEEYIKDKAWLKDLFTSNMSTNFYYFS